MSVVGEPLVLISKIRVTYICGRSSSNNKTLNARLLARVITEYHYKHAPNTAVTPGGPEGSYLYATLFTSCTKI
jgi:hypothetical protein